MMKRGRAIFFDVDGVLAHGYSARPDLQHPWDVTLEADLGVNADRFREEFIFGVFSERVIVGEMPLIDALSRALPGLGYSGSPMEFVRYWLSRDSKLNSELIEKVRLIRAHSETRLFIATNQEHLRAHWLWQGLGLHELFDDIYYSARLKVTKPSPVFFERISEGIGPQGEPPLLVDDRLDCIESARACGWEGLHFAIIDDLYDHEWFADILRDD